jgi:hypothetical protein
VTWLNPEEEYQILWDEGMCATVGPDQAKRELMLQAMKVSLSQEQSKVFFLEYC